ncbi:hypothetical protein ACP70R_012051 [Stipagrostis hirtigluma subsp. patula]
MSSLPLSCDVATNIRNTSGSDSSADQLCRQQSRHELAQESAFLFCCSPSAHQVCCHPSRDGLSSDSDSDGLALYCQPVLQYEKIQQRAKQKPSFLQRCLQYKIHAKQKKRILITIPVSGIKNVKLQALNIFPLYALLARPISAHLLEGHSPVYKFSQACLLTSFNDSRSNHTEAKFIVPDVTTLATSRARGLNIILVSCGLVGQTLGENECSENHVKNSFLQSQGMLCPVSKAKIGPFAFLSNSLQLGGKCFWGKIPVNLLHSSLENCVDLCLGRSKEFASSIIMSPGFIEPKFLEQDNCLTFCTRKFSAKCSYQLEVSICAQEAGAKDIFKSPYSYYLYSNVPSSSPDIIRLRVGNVQFNYMYGNSLHQKEVTEDFTCPICLVKCGSFMGLECHLPSSHDIFNFEFWVTEKYQGVNIKLKYHTSADEHFSEGVDPRHGRTFSYFSKYKKRRRLVTATETIALSKDGKMMHNNPLIMGSESPQDGQVGFQAGYVRKENGTSIKPAHSSHGGNLSPPRVLQFGKTRKLSFQSNPRNWQLLQKRQFFHSHKAQKMALEEVLSDHDSEDEVDDDVADFEDKKMIDSYDNVAKDERHIMQMWNSFVRRQRLAKNEKA